MNKDLISDINHSLEISFPDTISFEELKQKLAQHINHLINNDFEKLIFYLYRIDVDENKIRQLLRQKGGEDAPGLLAALIIERQLQKIKSRGKPPKDKNIPEEDRW